MILSELCTERALAACVGRVPNLHVLWQLSWENSFGLVSLIANIYPHIYKNNHRNSWEQCSWPCQWAGRGNGRTWLVRCVGRTTNCRNKASTSPAARDERETTARWLAERASSACAKLLTKRQYTQTENKRSTIEVPRWKAQRARTEHSNFAAEKCLGSFWHEVIVLTRWNRDKFLMVFLRSD